MECEASTGKLYFYMGRRPHEAGCLFLSAVVIGASIYLKPITYASRLVEIKMGKQIKIKIRG